VESHSQILRNFSFYTTILILNHVKIGNINHSRHFPQKFLPFVDAVIKKIKIKFLSSWMVQTVLHGGVVFNLCLFMNR
jgi:hypothetical protein